MLKGKNIVIGVSGGIACYKICDVVSSLKKLNANVDVIMTKNATEFVSPLTFETLSKNAVSVDMFEKKTRFDVEHISLAKKADIFVVAPASANVIAKMANGICDDMLTTTFLASNAKKLVCPSMNTNMLENKITQQNISKLVENGAQILESENGLLACGDVGKGKLPSPQTIVEKIKGMLLPKSDFAGKTVIVSAGGTRERIDAVRFITNESSGKMGIAIAKAFLKRGAKVILIAGSISVEVPIGVEFVKVESTMDMKDAVLNNLKYADIVVMSAAPADFRLKDQNNINKKIKAKNDLQLSLEKNPDIAKAVGGIKGDKKLIIFCAETDNLIENAQDKLTNKNADLIIANDVSKQGAGFNCDTNIISIIEKNGKITECPMDTKEHLADVILDKIAML